MASASTAPASRQTSPATRPRAPRRGDELQATSPCSRGDQFLGADKLTFDSETERYVAEGSIRYQDSRHAPDRRTRRGQPGHGRARDQDLSYQLVSRRGNGGADSITMSGTQGSLHGSTYSTCPPEDRRWELRAKRIDIDTEEGMGVARNAVLRVGKVPVLYVPWLMFPIDERRRTGLLFPSASNSDRNGFEFKQPIYLNLAPNYDATVTPRIMTERGAMLGSEFRYLHRTGAGSVSGALDAGRQVARRRPRPRRLQRLREPRQPLAGALQRASGSATRVTSRISTAASAASPSPRRRATSASTAAAATGRPA